MQRWDRFRLQALRIPPLAWAAAMVVGVLALGVAATTIDWVARLDATIVRELQGEVTVRGLEERVFAVTDLGGSPLLLVGIAVVATLLLVGRWRAALAIALAVTATKLTVAVVKAVVERERPETAFESHGTFSFPSGHAASAAALYMTLAVLLSRGHSAGVRATVILLGALLTIAVGGTRVLLGAHFPTDVLGGWLVGGLLGIAAWALIVRLSGRPARRDESASARVGHAAGDRVRRPPPIPDDAGL